MIKRNFVSNLHNSTKRDYLARMIDKKVYCMKIAKKYGKEYWDGNRRYGYGGYKYIPGRWKSVAKNLIKIYKLKAGSKILDVGCGKGYLLKEMLLILNSFLTLVQSNYKGSRKKPFYESFRKAF